MIGISIGSILIGITKFDYVEENRISKEYTVEMSDNLKIYSHFYELEYKVNDSNKVEMVFEYPENYEMEFSQVNENIFFDAYKPENKMQNIRKFIENINNRKIVNEESPKLYVYSSIENIKKLQENTKIENKPGYLRLSPTAKMLEEQEMLSNALELTQSMPETQE